VKLTDRFWVGAFSNTRCIVPMLGYYEWTGTKGDKQPHFIHGDGLLAAAGVYSRHQDEKTGHWMSEFAIVTREARDASGEVHDRMPAFLTPDLWDAWLSPASLTVKGNTVKSQGNRQELVDALEHSSTAIASTITTYEVDRRVNNHRAIEDHGDPTLIEPLS
jgi:putative SOS response-associated peptidase YedK